MSHCTIYNIISKLKNISEPDRKNALEDIQRMETDKRYAKRVSFLLSRYNSPQINSVFSYRRSILGQNFWRRIEQRIELEKGVLTDKKIKVYISGPMTGIANNNYEKFKECESVLKRTYGYKVINPHNLSSIAKKDDWKEYMRVDLKYLLDCDEIFVLDGWHKSKGAKIEMTIGRSLGMRLIKFPEMKIIEHDFIISFFNRKRVEEVFMTNLGFC